MKKLGGLVIVVVAIASTAVAVAAAGTGSTVLTVRGTQTIVDEQ
jgi:hypothetical protein